MSVQTAPDQSQTPPRPLAWLDHLLRLDRRLLIGVALSLAIAVGVLDWRTGPEVAIGAAYLFPVMLLSLVASRRQIVSLSVLCALVRGGFSVSYSPLDFLLRLVLAFAAFAATGLLISEIRRHHSQTQAYLQELKEQQHLKQEVEDHLRELAENSPAAIFTADEHGLILTWNEETRHLFGLPNAHSLRGERVSEFLPVLAGALRLSAREEVFRTSTQCQGRRLDGEPFYAQVWFSLYAAANGRKLAVIAVDISDEMREREEQNLRLLADQNRIIAGAVSHEVRNICGAISMAVSKLRGAETPDRQKEISALAGLVDTLVRIASTDLAAKSRTPPAPVSLEDVLGQLWVLIEPSWRECGGSVKFDIEPGTPRVMADPAGLTQVFLNLANNSHRAVRASPTKQLRFTVRRSGPEVHVVVSDTGVGIAPGVHLFEPFQQHASGVGLGLYVSRAVLRSYGGDLKHDETDSGCAFCVKLPAAV